MKHQPRIRDLGRKHFYCDIITRHGRCLLLMQPLCAAPTEARGVDHPRLAITRLEKVDSPPGAYDDDIAGFDSHTFSGGDLVEVFRGNDGIGCEVFDAAVMRHVE